jgi:hypothetical protein
VRAEHPAAQSGRVFWIAGYARQFFVYKIVRSFENQKRRHPGGYNGERFKTLDYQLSVE